MKKIITAINNPKLNEELKKEEKFEIIGKDIQYKEAILEILEKNNLIDLIIISEKIPGEINLEKLIEKIKIINNKIKIIFILEKENEKLEKLLIKNEILDIYYNNKIDLKELIKIINKKEINMEEEIIKLKKIIEEKSFDNQTSEKSIFKKVKRKNKKTANETNSKLKRKAKKKNDNENMSTKIITFSGNYKSGKSTLALIISQYLSEKNYKVLLIDGDLEKQDLSIILKSSLRNNYVKGKCLEAKEQIELYRDKNMNIFYSYKIYKDLHFFNSFKLLIESEKIKSLIHEFLRTIKLNYDFIIFDLSKNNLNILNQEILKNSQINFLLMEPNLLGIIELKKLLSIYLNEWKIFKNKLFIINNKKNITSMDKILIDKNIQDKNKIFEIRENKYYFFFINHYFKRKILLKNKRVKKEIDRIVNRVILKDTKV